MTSKDYTCRTVRHMLPLHVGGDLDPRHVDAVDDHVKRCLSCFREFRSYASMRSRMGVLAEERLPEGALEGFAEEVMARIAVGEPGPAAAAPGAAPIRWPVLPRLAAAAAVLIVCVAGWRYTTDGAIRPLDRPSAANPLAPPSTVGSTPSRSSTLPLASIPVAPLPDGAFAAPVEDRVPAGLQGLRPPSRAEAMLIRQAADAGMIILLPDETPGGQGPVDDPPEASSPLPRKR